MKLTVETTPRIGGLTTEIQAAESEIRESRSRRDAAEQELRALTETYQAALLNPEDKPAKTTAIEIQVVRDRVEALTQSIERQENELKPLIQERTRLLDLEAKAQEERQVSDLIERSKTEAAQAFERIDAGLSTLTDLQKPLHMFKTDNYPVKDRVISAGRAIDKRLRELLEKTLRQIETRQFIADNAAETLYQKHIQELSKTNRR